MSFINGIKRFASTTVGMMAIGIGSTILVFGTHRLIVSPYLSKKRRLEAEAWAEYIFQQELQQQQSKHNTNNNH
ncbi:uncharacterized protein LOC111518775 [Drosophila willistoni]|uniref:uncharacterized protein LOC111518775 n=1 Tax=Drosophila willistoni TaxID=7260 RepID=UPI000C26C96E|nr:uncharacterized protein LOC111518775 [Drosophila willistoni]